LAQNKGFVDPKVQVTTADVKGKGLLLEEGYLKPRRPATSHMLINKFQRQQEKQREEKIVHNVTKDIGDVRSSSTVEDQSVRGPVVGRSLL
jgi:ribosomal protein L35